MKKLSKILSSKIVLGSFAGIIALIIVSIAFQPVDDKLVKLVSSFDHTEQLTIAPNTFSDCEINNKISYVDSTGTKRLIGAKYIDAQPFTQYSLISTQTNRQIDKFLVEINGSCQVNAGFTLLKPTVDSGSVVLEIYGARQDGTFTKVYGKTSPITAIGKNISTSTLLFSVEIPASEIESKMPKIDGAYKSSLKIKPNIQMSIRYAPDNTKWTVGGQTETNLQVTVNNDQFICILSCIINNKEMKLTANPSSGTVPLDYRVVGFKVVLPEWTTDQGTPSFVVRDASGGIVINTTPISLSKITTDGIGQKSFLLPEKEGTYDLTVTSPGRNNALFTFKIVKTQIIDKPSPEQGCPEGYTKSGTYCLPPDTLPPNTPPNTPSNESEINSLMSEFFSMLILGDFTGLQDPKFYGIYAVIGIIFFIILILSAASRKSN